MIATFAIPSGKARSLCSFASFDRIALVFYMSDYSSAHSDIWMVMHLKIYVNITPVYVSLTICSLSVKEF